LKLAKEILKFLKIGLNNIPVNFYLPIIELSDILYETFKNIYTWFKGNYYSKKIHNTLQFIFILFPFSAREVKINIENKITIRSWKKF
jgi:hypothetical protein